MILIFTPVNLAPCISNSWEQMPASLGKECSHALNLGHILPPHRRLHFVKSSRNYSHLCQHPQQSACTVILPCHAIFIALLTRQCPCQLVTAGRITSCAPGARGKITTFLWSLFWPCAAPTQCCLSLDLKQFSSKMHYKSLRKLTVYACTSQVSSPWSLEPLNQESPHSYVYVQDLCIAALSSRTAMCCV